MEELRREGVNQKTAHRALRALEHMGLLKSTAVKKAFGGPRKKYSLTPLGGHVADHIAQAVTAIRNAKNIET